MKRYVAVGVLSAGLTIGGAGLAWSLAAGQDKSADTELNPDKQAVLAEEQRLAEENSALAGDPARSAGVVKQKDADYTRHVKELPGGDQLDNTWPTGIFDDSEAPASGMVFLGTNRWVGKVGGLYLAVYAGRSGEDSTTGRVMALWSDSRVPGYTLDLEGTGALEVVEADGSSLTLSDSTGEMHRLDAVTGEWTS